MRDFINRINDNNLMTEFIKNIFDYEYFYDYNTYNNSNNNSDSFENNDYDFKVIEESNVFVNYISIFKIDDSDNKLLKLAYLFKLDNDKMINYANTFLNKVFVDILKDIIK